MKHMRRSETSASRADDPNSAAHKLLYLAVIVSASACALSVSELHRRFSSACVFHPRSIEFLVDECVTCDIVVDVIESSGNKTSTYLKIFWQDSNGCHLPIYVSLLSSISGIIWLAMLLMFSAEEKSNTGLHRQWRLIPLALTFAFVMLILSFVASTVATKGVRSLLDLFRSSLPKGFVGLKTIQVWGYLVITSTWLYTLSWFLAVVMMLCRIILVVDFHLARIDVTLHGNISNKRETFRKRSHATHVDSIDIDIPAWVESYRRNSSPHYLYSKVTSADLHASRAASSAHTAAASTKTPGVPAATPVDPANKIPGHELPVIQILAPATLTAQTSTPITPDFETSTFAAPVPPTLIPNPLPAIQISTVDTAVPATNTVSLPTPVTFISTLLSALDSIAATTAVLIPTFVTPAVENTTFENSALKTQTKVTPTIEDSKPVAHVIENPLLVTPPVSISNPLNSAIQMPTPMTPDITASTSIHLDVKSPTSVTSMVQISTHPTLIPIISAVTIPSPTVKISTPVTSDIRITAAVVTPIDPTSTPITPTRIPTADLVPTLVIPIDQIPTEMPAFISTPLESTEHVESPPEVETGRDNVNTLADPSRSTLGEGVRDRRSRLLASAEPTTVEDQFRDIEGSRSSSGNESSPTRSDSEYGRHFKEKIDKSNTADSFLNPVVSRESTESESKKKPKDKAD